MSPPPSPICASAIRIRCHLPHISYLSYEACTHCVHIDCYLFTESSYSRRFFPDWATPVKLCSTVICLPVNCLLHQFLGSIQKGVRIPYQLYLINDLKKQVVDVRRCLLAISLTTCKLDDICEEVLH